MDISDVMTLINTVGFPIFVAVYMIMKGQKDNENMKETINELKIAVQALTDKIDQIGRE